jgi:putative ABC transport system permease protein
MEYLTYAFRNILQHRRRSLITILAVTFGYTALAVFGGMVNNIFQRLKDQAITVEKLGHLTVAKEGFFTNGKMEPEKYIFTRQESDSLLAALRSDPAVKLATPRLRLFGIASNGKASTIFLSEAIVPDEDKVLTAEIEPGNPNVTGIVNLPTDRETEVAIGSELSSILGVGEEQYLTLLTNTVTGMANAVDAKVNTVYNTGNPATNDKYVLMPYGLAQKLYDTEGCERIVVLLKDEGLLEADRARLTEKLNGMGFVVEIQTWNELSLFYERVTAMFGVIFRVISVIITLVVLLTMLNTVYMSVTERTREIGTLRAMGMQRSTVIRIFVYEALLMGILGVVLSAIPITLVYNLMAFLKISFIPPVASAPVMIKLVLQPPKLVAVFAMFIVSALLASLFASRGAARKKITDALGFT